MNKPKFRSKLHKTAAIAAALTLITTSTSISALASENSKLDIDTAVHMMLTDGGLSMSNNYVVDDPKMDTSPLPSKFDLRDVDGKCYVPAIKIQNPFGSCWSFGASAAAEISLASEHDADFNTMTEEEKAFFDFSERHTAWFAFEPIHDDDPLYSSQAGEGLYYVYSSEDCSQEDQARERLDGAGSYYYTLPLYASGVGPVPESFAPYRNDEGLYKATLFIATIDENGEITDQEWLMDDDNISYSEYEAKVNEVKELYPNYRDGVKGAGKYYYAEYGISDTGNWSLDYSKKYFFATQLDNASSLPSPAVAGQNGEYSYDEKATNAIKRELTEGRAVSISYSSDQSNPGDIISPDKTYMSFRTADGKVAEDKNSAAIWAHYTYDKGYDPADPNSVNKTVRINHAVTIVGYDDNFPKEYFNDPKGTIGGDGAWIVRNSWGSINYPDERQRDYWGNNGDGYFYLSYYDQSINTPQSYDFRTVADGYDDNFDGIFNHMYDLTPNPIYSTKFDSDMYMANEFVEEGDSLLTDVGINTATPNSTVQFEIYFLDENSKTPTNGEKVCTVEKTFDYGGFHCVHLDKAITIPEGQKYSIVAKMKREDGKSALSLNVGMGKAYADAQLETCRAAYIAEHGSDEGFNPAKYRIKYSKSVINKGESFIGIQQPNVVEWNDWSNVAEKMSAESKGMAEFDNFPIRAYVKGNTLTVKNEAVDPKEVYNAGDVLEGTVTIINEAVGDTPLENIKVTDSLGAISEADSTIDKLAFNESRTINYKYTVTEEDAKAGTLTNTINITVNDKPYEFIEELAKNALTVKTAVKEEPVTPVEGVKGDANGDGVLNIRDAAFIAKAIAQGKSSELPIIADFNGDGVVNVRDAAAIGKHLAGK